MMSPPFTNRDKKMANGQLKLWTKLNARAQKKVRKR